MYEGPLRTNAKSVKTSILVLKVIQGHCGNYCGCPSTEFELFDAELVELVIYKMKRGKAAGLDGITTEHLLYSHALLPGIWPNCSILC